MIHLGKIIKEEVEKRQLPVKLFAGLINQKEDEVIRLFDGEITINRDIRKEFVAVAGARIGNIIKEG